MRKKFLLLVGLSCSLNPYSQTTGAKEYVVITFERKRAKDIHPPKNFFWIVEVDSIRGKDFDYYPLYFSFFSKEDFLKCYEHKTIDIFVTTTGSTYDFNKEEAENREKLITLIESNRRKVQTIVKNWPSGRREELTVYVTSIQGEFCNCPIGFESGSLINYQGLIFLPSKGFSLGNFSWQSEKANFVLTKDYSLRNFINNIPN